MPLCLHTVNLSHFRNHATLRLAPAGARMVVLTGHNGAGKTNILEAVSLLAPGRGLRGAELADIKDRTGSPWAVAAEIETPDGALLRLGTGISPDGARRIVRVNGRDAKSQGELAGLVSAVWLTPQMDRIFLDGRAQRRRFLDRLVFSWTPAHAGGVARHDRALRERLRLLQAPRPDPAWLDAVEAQIAAEGAAIAAARVEFLRHLQAYALRLKEREMLFPVPLLALDGAIEARIGRAPAQEIEEEMRASLRRARAGDAQAGRTEHGVHRTDLRVSYADKNMEAAQCSTGEQKGLLISLVLAHALMMQAEKGFVPLLLLDEVAAHLDEARRAQLFSFLAALDGQVWMTGTDAALFAPVKDVALFVELGVGRVSPRLEVVS